MKSGFQIAGSALAARLMLLVAWGSQASAAEVALTAAGAPALLRVYPSGGDVGVWIGIFEACVRKPVNP